MNGPPMQNKYKTIPLGVSPPYTLEDLSVIIPHEASYVKRLKWFLPQYFRGTPAEVIKNTIIAYDPGDKITEGELERYGMKGVIVNKTQSTYKFEGALKEVKTRLCVRMHNDTQIVRNDWAQVLVDRFNQLETPQMIGQYHPSGDLSMESIDRLKKYYPWMQSLYNNLELYTTDRGDKRIGCAYFHAFFIASQTYIFKEFYPFLVEYTDGQMDKEDCFLSLIVSLNGIHMTAWHNITEFCKNIYTKKADFEEEMVSSEPMMITEENRINFSKAIWRETPFPV